MRVSTFGKVLIFLGALDFATLRAEPVPVKRPVEILPESKVSAILAKLPPVTDGALRDILDSPDTMWYDRTVIIPGYQDSFGDSVTFPTGFRPNTIERMLIDLAVPGGHAMLFIRSGEFHFPFGRTGGVDDASNTFVVDFWRLPKSQGRFLPVVWWKWEPNGNTHRTEWMFPEGTVFGEVIFITDSQNRSHVFEIRTRTRKLDSWTVEVYRPFPTAESFAAALELKRKERPAWASSASIGSLLGHLRNTSTLTTSQLQGGHFKGAFEPVQGAVDNLPPVDDENILIEMLHETPFQSAKNSVWKSSGGMTAYAASTKSAFHIVPQNYNAAVFQMTDEFCARCHQDAGRPIKGYYFNLQAYGELWGEDETFSWHPFDAKYFVDANGKVVNFNNDNRRFRQDFLSAGLLEKYEPAVHSAQQYRKIPRAWKNYRY